jgi:O-antigen ligase
MLRGAHAHYTVEAAPHTDYPAISMHVLRTIRTLIISLYTFAVLATFMSVADQPLARLGFFPVSPTLGALLLVAPFAASRIAADLMTKSHRFFAAPIQRNIAPLGAFLAIVIVSLTHSALPGAFWEEGGKWIFLVCYGFCLSLFALSIPNRRWFARVFPFYGLATLVLLGWSIYLDISLPGTFAELGQRPAGFPGNANFAALVAVMICAASLDYRPCHGLIRNVLLFIVTGAVMITTMSRSGALNFALLVAILSYTRMCDSGWSPREIVKVTTTTAIMIGVCVGLAVGAVITGTISEETRLGRLLNNKQVDDGSAGSRLFAVQESLRLINDAPLLGHGTGHARTMRELPHNLYLQQWVNNGLLGIVALVTFLGTTLLTFIKRRFRPGQAFMLVTIVGGVFSHNILDQRCFLLLLGILLALSSYEPSPAIARYSSTAR